MWQVASSDFEAELVQRIQRARSLLLPQGIDALLLFSGPNLTYFTGMPCGRSGSRPFVLVLPREGDMVLIVHDGRQHEARAFAHFCQIRTYSLLSHLPREAVYAVLRERSLLQARIGLELSNEMVLDLPETERTVLYDVLSSAICVDASGLLWQLRMVKSPYEAACVARACQITADAYEHAFAAARRGMTEAEIEGLMLRAMIERGGRSPWLNITSGSGHYDTITKAGSARSVEPGDMVWMDGGCSVAGYFSDFGRAGVVGGPSREQADAQRQIHDVTMMAVRLVRPGAPVRDIAGFCNQALADLDLPVTSNITDLAGRSGHGLGMLVTEQPSISEQDQTVLSPGMIVTIEPGVATAFGVFHVEENVLTTEGDPQVLSSDRWQLKVI
jgi:Xaa-Pro aminopeptidase